MPELLFWLPLALLGVLAIACGWQARRLGVARTRLQEREVALAGAEAERRLGRERIAALETALAREGERLACGQEQRLTLETALATARAELAREREAAGEKEALLEQARTRLSETFAALSAEALRRNNASFIDLATRSLQQARETAREDLDQRRTAIAEMLTPVRESLAKVDHQIAAMEKTRTGAYESLTQYLRSLQESQGALRQETHQLVQALRSPTVRGRWGEVQLRRVVELAGMLEHCDFEQQPTLPGGLLRPDLVVRLPAGTSVVVDAKTPLAAYLDAMEARDETVRGERLAAHANAVRSHVVALSAKGYWEQFENAPEFVVLFLPGEPFFSSALEHDPALIEFATRRRVILATPTTLISLLKAVFYGWRQQRLARNAETIAALGRELHQRVAGLAGHLERMGRSLNQCVEHYNRLVATTERRVLVTARRFGELEPGQEPIAPPAPLEQNARPLQSEELASTPEGDEPA